MPITHSVYTYLSNKCINFLLILNWLVGQTFLIGVRCARLVKEREKMWSRATPQMGFDTKYLVIFLRPRLILRVAFLLFLSLNRFKLVLAIRLWFMWWIQFHFDLRAFFPIWHTYTCRFIWFQYTCIYCVISPVRFEIWLILIHIKIQSTNGRNEILWIWNGAFHSRSHTKMY